MKLEKHLKCFPFSNLFHYFTSVHSFRRIMRRIFYIFLIISFKKCKFFPLIQGSPHSLWVIYSGSLRFSMRVRRSSFVFSSILINPFYTNLFAINPYLHNPFSNLSCASLSSASSLKVLLLYMASHYPSRRASS